MRGDKEVTVKYRIVYMLYSVPAVEQLLSWKHEPFSRRAVSVSLHEFILKKMLIIKKAQAERVDI